MKKFRVNLVASSYRDIYASYLRVHRHCFSLLDENYQTIAVYPFTSVESVREIKEA